MKRLAFVLCLLAVPACAQQQPPNPCQRGTSRMSFAGVDLDAMRCELAIANATVSDLTGQNMKLMAALKMAESDAAAEKAARTAAAEGSKKKADAGKVSDKPKDATMKP